MESLLTCRKYLVEEISGDAMETVYVEKWKDMSLGGYASYSLMYSSREER